MTSARTNSASSAATALALAAALAAAASACQPSDQTQASPTAAPAATDTAAVDAPGVLYGRVTTYGGAVYQGRLRWGGGEEAFWNDTFNGVKDESPWAGLAPVQRLTEERRPARVLGFEVPWGEPQVDLSRPFMARFGDIARVEARGDGVQGVVERGVGYDPDVRVTLRSGAVVDLDRLSASDFDDGVRVWDRRRGAVDLGPRQIRSIEFLSTPPLTGVPSRLHGTVRAKAGTFTGFLQWDRELAVGSDALTGRAGEETVRVRFDAVAAIVRQPDGRARAVLRDGRELAVSSDGASRGVYVHDPRYGRVLVSWDAFERLDLSPPPPASPSGPGYGDFAPGEPLAGRVTTRSGRRLAGRLVYDLDESETTETLDAPAAGVDYSVPFGRIASVDLTGPDARVTLRTGEVLALRRAGDLGDGNGGVLVFAPGQEPEYLPWADVARVDFDRPLTATAGGS